MSPPDTRPPLGAAPAHAQGTSDIMVGLSLILILSLPPQEDGEVALVRELVPLLMQARTGRGLGPRIPPQTPRPWARLTVPRATPS